MIALPPGGVRAALPDLEPNFAVRSWDTEDGLPQSPVNALARTGEGYLWLGTEVGLVRFDGVRFRLFQTNQTPALGDNRICSLLVDDAGVLWAGTRAGTLARREGTDFVPVPLDARLRGVAIQALQAAPGGGLWLGTSGRGVVRFRDGSCDFSLPTKGLPQGRVMQLFGNRGEFPWVGTGNRLMMFEEGRWRNVPTRGEPGGLVYAAVAEAGDSILLARQERRGGGSFRTRVLRLGGVPSTEVFSPYLSGWGRIGPMGLNEDPHGRVWLWTAGEGVSYWAGAKGWRSLDTLAVPKWTKVSVSLADADGFIWMASRDGELFRINEQLATVVGQPVEPGRTIVRTCGVTRDGTVWLGTDAAGVFRFEAGRFVQETNGLASLHAAVIFEDSRTNLWVGTYMGLHRWDGRQFHRLTHGGLDQGTVLALCEDHAGNLWIGNSARGVARLAPNGEVAWHGASAGLKSYNIRAIVEDTEGRICVSAPPQGLLQLREGQFEILPRNRWAGAGYIHALLPERGGGLWITTYGRGLFFFKDGGLRQWGLRDGLPDVNLHGIAADEDGNLWIGSNRGIFGCARTNLLDYQPGSSAPLPCWRLTTANGLASKMTSGAGQPVVARSADGRFWFPNLHALAVFDPKEVVGSRRSFPPVFEEVVSDGVAGRPGADGVFRLASGVRRLELYYSCAELATPELLRFRYKLEGNDVRWTEAGNQRVAYYGRLAPGDYRFRVMAAGPSGEWRETERSLAITVVPLWWERPAVKVAGGLALLLLMGTVAWMIGRSRLRRQLAFLERQRALERERTRIARDIHDELGAGLTQISLLGSMTAANATNGEQVRNQAEKVGDVSRRLTRALDEIVWAVRPQNDRLSRVVQYIAAMTHDLCDGTAVQSLFEFPASLPEVEVPANARHNLVLACREAVTNALKHSGATELHLRVELEARALVVEILDDGRGFDDELADPERSGLRNMRQRLAEVGGTCEFQRMPEGGTRVRFWMPLQASAVAAETN